KDRRGEVDDPGAGGFYIFVELDHAGAEAREAVFAEGLVDAVVHAVAGEDQVGPGPGQHAVEALVQVGAGELAVGVAFFAEAGNGLAGEAAVNDLEGAIGEAKEKLRFDVVDVLAALGDTVAEEED